MKQCSNGKHHQQSNPSNQEKALSRREFLEIMGTLAAGLVVVGCQRKSPVQTLQPTGPSTPVPSPQPTAVSVASSTSPIGIAKGIYPGRVVWVHNPEATSWDGSTGHWWDEGNIDQATVSEMFSQALRKQTGQPDDRAAWQALFKYFNDTHDRPGTGYQAGEKIAIKINMNTGGSPNYQGNASFTSPPMICALLRQLVTEAGVPATDIAVYDATRYIPDSVTERCRTPELAGVQFVDWAGGIGKEVYRRDLKCQIHWSEDVHGNPTYLPTCVTQAQYIINLASLKGHNLAGVSLCAKNHFGTLCSDLEGKPTQQAPQGANIHGYVAAHDYSWGPEWTWPQRPMGTYNALVDLMGHKHLGAKTLLFMLDGLYASENQSDEITHDSRWQSKPFGNNWPSSLFISQDGVAIDSVGLDFLRSEPTILKLPDVLPPNSTADNYLHESALADKPPSKTRYDPAGDGGGLTSLGVHEHWNNPVDKQYSRNLGTGEGIELVQVA